MKLTQNQKDMVIDMLDMNGSTKAIQIEKALKQPHQETAPAAREVIRQLIDEGWPIVSDSDGYWLAGSSEQVSQYVANLSERALKILKRGAAVREAWINWKGVA